MDLSYLSSLLLARINMDCTETHRLLLNLLPQTFAKCMYVSFGMKIFLKGKCLNDHSINECSDERLCPFLLCGFISLSLLNVAVEFTIPNGVTITW